MNELNGHLSSVIQDFGLKSKCLKIKHVVDVVVNRLNRLIGLNDDK